MNGSIIVTPGYIFQKKRNITTANLNSWANPTAVLEDEAITKYELDYEVLGPQETIISTSSSTLTLTVDTKRVFNTFDVTLNQNVSLTVSGTTAGQIIQCAIHNSGGYTITFSSTNHYLLSTQTSPVTPASIALLSGWCVDSSWMWTVANYT